MTPVSRRAVIAWAGASTLGLLPSTSRAQTSLKVMIFPSISNLPMYAAQQKGFHAKHGLSVEILHTPNSDVLRDGLAKGDHQIVHAGIDNAVAMADVAKVDIAIFLGGDSGNISLYVQPEIKSYDDLRGKTVAVDAPNTAYALLLYKMLEVKGLKRSEYQVKPVGGTHQRIEALLKDKTIAAAMLNPPFSIRAEREGLKEIASAVSVVGPYQAGAAWTLRSWAKANDDVLVRYVQAHLEGLRWVLDPNNKAEASEILASRLRISSDVAAKSYDLGVDPVNGFARDGKVNIEGFTNVLKLRAEMLKTWDVPPPTEKYLDMSYYNRAATR